MSRPQKISTTIILQAAYELIMEEGPQQLTFHNLGKKVGLVPAALAKRFTNKRKLLAAIDRYALEKSEAAMSALLQTQDSPLEAIIILLSTELSFATSIKRFTNGQRFLLADLVDPELYANYQLSVEQRYDHITELLREAQRRQELVADIDCRQLARLLQIVQQGTGHLWAMTQEMSIEQYMRQQIWLTLQPYLLENNS